MEKIMKIISKYKVLLFCLLVIIMALISIPIQEYNKNNSKNININNKKIQDTNGRVAIHITGAILNEGVYYTQSDAILEDVIKLAGGFKPNANTENINLANKVINGDKIIIPFKENKIIETDTKDNNKSTPNKININTANKELLDTLPGIGESTAKKIIDYREKKQFVQIEDIMQVTGIGASKFDKIKDSICTD